MKNSKQTSARAASAASAVLRDGRTSAKSKTAAGSALAQRPSKVSAKYCYITHELRLHQNDRCKRFTPV